VSFARRNRLTQGLVLPCTSGEQALKSLAVHHIALVSASAAAPLDEDLPPLLHALRAAGARAEVTVWDDARVPWGAFDAAVLRSAWDYAERLPQFLHWAEQVSSATCLLNPLSVVRWNTDKHYLRELARHEVPIVPSLFIESGEEIERPLERFLETHPDPELVVKPAVGAGSRDAQRHRRRAQTAIRAHIARLTASGRGALLQPYLTRVNEQGETALVYIEGRFSHAARKGPLLALGAEPTALLFAPEEITPRTPTPEELEVGQRALAAVPHPQLLYARVDLIRDAANAPCVLELELTEPSLFLRQHASAAHALAQAILRALDRARAQRA
jgi:glutathione synthase/RimK-type ligase-like ATP-grasp enzyme